MNDLDFDLGRHRSGLLQRGLLKQLVVFNHQWFGLFLKVTVLYFKRIDFRLVNVLEFLHILNVHLLPIFQCLLDKFNFGEVQLNSFLLNPLFEKLNFLPLLLKSDLQGLYFFKQLFFFIVWIVFKDFQWVQGQTEFVVFGLEFVGQSVYFLHQFVGIISMIGLVPLSLFLEIKHSFFQHLDS